MTDEVVFVFESNVGAAPLAFGGQRADIRVLLERYPHKLFTTNPENDYYTGNGFILGYDEEDKLEYIEVFRPAVAVFDGFRLFDCGLRECLVALKMRGLEAPLNDASYDFPNVGLIMYCTRGAIVESASIYREGYYR